MLQNQIELHVEMSSGFLLKVSFILLLLCGTLHVSGIEIPADAPKKHSFSEADWQKITRDIDYSKDTAPPPRKRNPSSSEGFDLGFSPAAAKIIIFTLVFALLVFILMKIMKGNMLLGDKKLNTENAFIDVNPEEDIHRSNLEELYAQALAARNFRLAVRYCYLIIIRELSNKQFIMWKKEKTNTDYIFDMMNNVFNKPFREVTFLFEKIWYGETELSEQNFQLVNSRFNEFITEVKNNPSAEVSKSTTDS